MLCVVEFKKEYKLDGHEVIQLNVEALWKYYEGQEVTQANVAGSK